MTQRSPLFRLRSKLLIPCWTVAALFSGSLPSAAQKVGKPAAARTTKSSGAAARSQTTQLASLLAQQSAAVSLGDPVRIAKASRQLNAELYFLLAQLRLADQDTEGAVPLLESSVRSDSTPERRLQVASALLRNGRSEAALAQADAVLSTDPGNIAALTTRASALRAVGRYAEAANALQQALARDPSPKIAFALGAVLLSLHEKTKADAVFAQLLRVSENKAFWYVAVGDAYRDAGDLDEAVRNLQKGLALDPKVQHGEFFLGLAYLQMNQWGPSRESFEHLRKAVALAPRDYVSNFYLGALEATDGSDLVASNRHLHAAAVADPTQPEVWLYLGLNANRERRAAEAKADLQKAIALTGRDEARNNYQIRRAYFALGRILVADGDREQGEALLARYKQAEQAAVAESANSIAHASGNVAGGDAGTSLPTTEADATQATPPGEVPTREAQKAAEAKLKPLLASSLNDLGTAEARQHDYAHALSDFQESERWDSSNSLTFRNLGTAAFRVGNNQEATRALDDYRKRQEASGHPAEMHAELLLAMAQFALGHFADAIENFKAAGDLPLQENTTAYSYAFALARAGRAQDANKVADTLLANNPDKDLLPLVCHLYIDTENYAGSQTCYRKALQAEPGLTLAHYEIGESLIHLDRPAEAIPELRQELQSDPQNPNVTTALAFALLQTSQKDEARQILQNTVEKHPEHAEAQYELGKLLLEQGDLQAGITHLEQSEATDGTRDYVHYQLGTAYRKLGKAPEAEREFKIYRQIKDQNRNAHAVPH